MSEMRIEIAGGQGAFRPGETLEGTASWELDAAGKAVEVRLFWTTEGKGTVDVEVVDKVRFEAVSAVERRDFRFVLPKSPYSFSGKLISLLWGVEVVAVPGENAGRASFTMSPSGREILLRKEGTP